MNSYLVVESARGTSIHKARAYGVGFKTLDEAVRFIDYRRLTGVQIIARDGNTGIRRWLTHDEQKELGRTILREQVA